MIVDIFEEVFESDCVPVCEQVRQCWTYSTRYYDTYVHQLTLSVWHVYLSSSHLTQPRTWM